MTAPLLTEKKLVQWERQAKENLLYPYLEGAAAPITIESADLLALVQVARLAREMAEQVDALRAILLQTGITI